MDQPLPLPLTLLRRLLSELPREQHQAIVDLHDKVQTLLASDPASAPYVLGLLALEDQARTPSPLPPPAAPSARPPAD